MSYTLALFLYVYFFIESIFGDPHLYTIDGVPYSFNGHGEYVLIKEDPTSPSKTVIQCRMVKASDKDGSPVKATIFSAFAIKAATTGKLTVRLNKDKAGKYNLQHNKHDI